MIDIPSKYGHTSGLFDVIGMDTAGGAQQAFVSWKHHNHRAVAPLAANSSEVESRTIAFHSIELSIY